MVTFGQIVLLALAIISYVGGGIASALPLAGRKVSPSISRLCLLAGIAFSAALLIWHSVRVVGEIGTWQPLQDDLSAMVTLSVLLALFVAYTRFKRPVPSLEWLMMPVVVLLLLLAGHFGTTNPEAYLSTTYYAIVHRVATYLGAVAFMVAGVAGVLYLLSDRNLRSRRQSGPHVPPKPGVFGSLERLDRLTYNAVTLGFALFTLGLVTGLVWIHHSGAGRLGPHWYLAPKVALSLSAWVVFAIVLHTPIAPRLRGRKNAILSIFGLVLTIASIVAVLLMAIPAGGEH